MLHKVVKDGDVILCEEHQISRFTDQGYELIVEEAKDAVAVDSSFHNTNLVAMTKDGDVRLYEINQVPVMRRQGWVEGGHDGEHKSKSDDQGPRAPEGKPSAAQGSSSDLGKSGSGSGSSSEAKSDDESPEGWEDLDLRILEALDKLDQNDDSHWTALGNPSVHAVRKIMDFDVTSAQIKAVAPNLTRDKD